MKRAVVAAIGLVLLASCRSDTVDLTYRYAPGKREYRLVAAADATVKPAGGKCSYRIVYRVTETVEPSARGGAVTLALRPTDRDTEGCAPEEFERSYSVEMGPDGEIFEVLEVDGLPPRRLTSGEVALIGLFRPPLPARPLPVRGHWDAEQAFQLSEGAPVVATEGRLDALGADGSGLFARLSLTRTGTLSGSARTPQGPATFKGTSRAEQWALVDLDNGSLRHATVSETTRQKYQVRRRFNLARARGTIDEHITLRVERVD